MCRRRSDRTASALHRSQRTTGGNATAIRRSAVAAGVPRSPHMHAAAARRRFSSMAVSTPEGRSAPKHRRPACRRRSCRCSTRNRNHVAHGRHESRAPDARRSAHAMHVAERPRSHQSSPQPSPAASRPPKNWPPLMRAQARRRARARRASAQCVADRAGSWYKAGSRPRMVRIGRCVGKATMRDRAFRRLRSARRSSAFPDARSR
jgi:hypothetical protein